MKIKFFFTLLLFPLLVFGQVYTGIVVDLNDKPIESANIFQQTKKNHVHSNANGEFVLDNIQVGDTIIVTHIAYEKYKHVVSSISAKERYVLIAKTFTIEEVVITPRLDVLNLLTIIDTQVKPVNSSQEVLRQVPGLFIGQHAGGGKAEQIFLRGFDIDHGTDLSISVDGMPVNMVSHAHGQGYADLHFVIPETVEKIDFGKGTYYADKGNFTTAGYVAFQSKEKLDHSVFKVEGGQFNTQRVLGMFNVLDSYKSSAYIATEYIKSDGPFHSPQNFSRINLMGKYVGYGTKQDKYSISASHFTSTWDASGQIPQRAVDNNLIDRFGAIDDTEGGTTSRTNLVFDYQKTIDRNTKMKSSLFYSKYDFELFSNFTFFLNDPINGDQIKQYESRSLFGVQTEYDKHFSSKNFTGDWQVGVQLRNDRSNDNQLARTANRTEILENIQLGDINETNMGTYANASLVFGKWTVNPGVRLDYFHFNYEDELTETFTRETTEKTIVSPKLNVLFNASEELQLYLKTGKGFHSNDTRVVLAQQNEILPAAYSGDIGFVWKPSSKVLLNVAYWNLYLEQEFVYVGDEGVVEPSGETTRSGVDMSIRYQPYHWLVWDFDANYTHARSINEPEGENYIPLAPDFTLVSGVNLEFKNGFYGGVHLRYLDDRAANEDNSIIAEGYTVTDLNIGYKVKQMDFGVQVQNLFDVEWNETQFATNSRLQGEDTPVEEIHFTPGTPFFINASVAYMF